MKPKNKFSPFFFFFFSLLILTSYLLTFTSCSNPAGELEEKGTVSITIGGGSERSTWPFTDAYIQSLFHKITVTGSNGVIQTSIL